MSYHMIHFKRKSLRYKLLLYKQQTVDWLAFPYAAICSLGRISITDLRVPFENKSVCSVLG